MNFDTFLSFATLVGFLTMALGAVAFAGAGLAFVQRRLPTLRCVMVMDDEFCTTHGCGAFSQCGKVSCPHCVYKVCAVCGQTDCPQPCISFAPYAEVGRPDVLDEALKEAFADTLAAGHTNYSTGEPCGPECKDDWEHFHVEEGIASRRRPDADCVTRLDCDNGGACVPPHCGRPPLDHAVPQEDEPVKIRLRRVKPDHLFYNLGADGAVDEIVETDEAGHVIEHMKLNDDGPVDVLHAHDGHRHEHPCVVGDGHTHPEDVPSPGNEPAFFPLHRWADYVHGQLEAAREGADLPENYLPEVPACGD